MNSIKLWLIGLEIGSLPKSRNSDLPAPAFLIGDNDGDC